MRYNNPSRIIILYGLSMFVHIFCSLMITVPMGITITVSEAVGITFSITFILALLIGIALGAIVDWCCMKCKTKSSTENNETSVQLQGQCYETISPSTPANEEVSMDINVAYSAVKH